VCTFDNDPPPPLVTDAWALARTLGLDADQTCCDLAGRVREALLQLGCFA
jgi:hypothetical protein